MEAENFFCEEECISVATKFYLGKAAKRKVCDEHAHSVPQALYPIEAFDFISSAEDAVLYEQRLQSVARGRKRLELVKEKAREELETALQALVSAKEKAVQIVEKGYEANKRRTQQLHFQIEVGVDTLNQQFDHYLKSRESEVSKAGSLVMTGDEPIPSLLQTRVFDNSLELLEVAFQGMCQAQLPFEEYLSRVLDPELRRKEAEEVLQMAEVDSRTGDFICLQNAAFKCSHSMDLCFSDKAAEMSNSIELKLKETEQGRANDIEELFTSDTQALCSFIDTQMKDIKTLETAKEWDKVKPSYLRAISYITAFSCSKETAGLYFSFANFLAARKRNGEAETYYNLALAIQKEHFPEDVQTADTYRKLGKIYSLGERIEDAESCYKLAISIRKLKLPNDYKTSKTYYKLGVLYQSLKRYQEASEEFSLALNVQRVCVPNQDNLVRILRCLGEVFRDMNRYEESVQYYTKAIQEDAPNTWRQVELYKALGDVYKSVQQNRESEESYNSALSIVKSLPLSSIKDELDLNNLGVAFEKLKRCEEAKFCYQTCSAILNEKGTDNKMAALLLANMGGIKLRSNKYSEGIQHYNAALRILVVHYPNKRFTAQVYLDLGLVHMQLSHLKEAEHCFRTAGKILDGVAPSSVVRALAYLNLGIICHKAERYKEAEQCESLLLVQLETQFPNEMITAMLLMNLGALYLDTDRSEDAQLCFVKGIQILEFAHPNQLHFLGALYFDLAKSCMIQANTEGAKNYFVKGISLRPNDSEDSTGNKIICYEFPKEVEDENRLDDLCVKTTQVVIILPNFLCAAGYLLGVIFFNEKQYQESEHYLIAALHHAEATGDERCELDARSKLKELYFKTKQFEKLKTLS